MSDWLIYDTETGAILRYVDAGLNPNPSAGEAAARIPGSAKVTPPLTQWSADARGFVDVPAPPAIDIVDAFALFTEAELAAILSSGVPAVLGLVLGLIITTLRGQKVRLDSTYHQQGALLLFQTGYLTQPRYEQFRAGIAPNA